jgi:hypothetical protein
MEVEMNLKLVGKWAFIIGLVLAVFAGIFFKKPEWVIWVLAILGVIVGILNVAVTDTQKFLLAAIALTLSAAALNTVPLVGTVIKNILGYVAAFTAGAMVVVALKALFETSR